MLGLDARIGTPSELPCKPQRFPVTGATHARDSCASCTRPACKSTLQAAPDWAQQAVMKATRGSPCRGGCRSWSLGLTVQRPHLLWPPSAAWPSGQPRERTCSHCCGMGETWPLQPPKPGVMGCTAYLLPTCTACASCDACGCCKHAARLHGTTRAVPEASTLMRCCESFPACVLRPEVPGDRAVPAGCAAYAASSPPTPAPHQQPN